MAKLELQHNSKISALARTGRQTQTVKLIQGDLDQPETLAKLPVNGTLLYYFAPPPGKGLHDLRMKNFLNSLAGDNLPAKIIYISTTGIYGDQNGAWVNENTPPQPQTTRAKRRLDAEQRLQHWGKTRNIHVTILRVAGIYSPNRLPIEAIKQRRPVLHPTDAPYSNRIHADDLAHICIISSRHKNKTGMEIFNVTDGQISTMTDYYHGIADALNLPRCPEITRKQAEQQLSPAMLSYLDESRRIDNHKMLHNLKVTLMYPELTTGLAAMMAKHLPL